MKRITTTLFAIILLCCGAAAQPARAVLDKVAAAVSNKGGVSAGFSISSRQYGNASGTIAIKGRKFRTTMQTATVWFDGKTQWTYVKSNNEVNINTPTEGELQAINPYNFIKMRQGANWSTISIKNFKKANLSDATFIFNPKSYPSAEIIDLR